MCLKKIFFQLIKKIKLKDFNKEKIKKMKIK